MYATSLSVFYDWSFAFEYLSILNVWMGMQIKIVLIVIIHNFATCSSALHKMLAFVSGDNLIIMLMKF